MSIGGIHTPYIRKQVPEKLVSDTPERRPKCKRGPSGGCDEREDARENSRENTRENAREDAKEGARKAAALAGGQYALSPAGSHDKLRQGR